MPPAFLPAAILGGAAISAGVGAAGQASAAKSQSRAAQNAANQDIAMQIVSGDRARSALMELAPYVMQAMQEGTSASLGTQYGAADIFTPQRMYGQMAQERIADALLTGGGLQDLVESDPGLAYQRRQGEQGLARMAAAAGGFGSGASLRGMSELNQDISSQYLDRALSRLGGLADVGRQGDLAVANILGGIAQTQQGVGNNLAQFASSLGNQIAGTYGINTSSFAPYQMANIQAQGMGAAAPYQGIANAFNAGTSLLGMYGMSGGFGGQSPTTNPIIQNYSSVRI